MRIRPDSAGMKEILNSADVAAAVNEVAKQIAQNVGTQGLSAVSAGAKSTGEITAVVDPYHYDRAAAAVSILHPAAIAMQARHGVLTKAAAAAGFEVKSKGN